VVPPASDGGDSKKDERNKDDDPQKLRSLGPTEGSHNGTGAKDDRYRSGSHCVIHHPLMADRICGEFAADCCVQPDNREQKSSESNGARIDDDSGLKRSILTLELCREWDKHNGRQRHEVEPQQHSIPAFDLDEYSVMCQPERSNNGKTEPGDQDLGKQFVQGVSGAGIGQAASNAQVEDQQGDRDCEHAIAEGK